MPWFSGLSPIFHVCKQYRLKSELTCSFPRVSFPLCYLVNMLLQNEGSSLSFSKNALEIINVLELFLLENPWHDHMCMLKEVACNLKAFSPLLIEGQFLKNTVYQEAFPLSFKKSLFQISAISCVWRHPGHEIPLSLTAEDVYVSWTLILDNNEAVRRVMSKRLCAKKQHQIMQPEEQATSVRCVGVLGGEMRSI